MREKVFLVRIESPDQEKIVRRGKGARHRTYKNTQKVKGWALDKKPKQLIERKE